MAKKRSSYLSSLVFDAKLYQSLQAAYLKSIRLPILLILTIIVVGVAALLAIPRRLNPEIKIPIVVVNTALPGAGPDDIEQLVTIPLERKLASVDGLDTMSSTSRDSSSSIALQFLSSVPVDEAVADVQTIVDTVSGLPDDSTTPQVRSVDFEDQPFWTFAITTQSDEASLMRFADELQKKIEDVSQVDRVQTSGLDEQVIEVSVDLKKAREFNLNPVAISQIVQSAAKSFPAGTVTSDRSSFSLTINQDIKTVDDIRNLRLDIGGASVKLGDVATVSTRSKTGQFSTYLSTQKQASKRTVQFFVFKKKNANIDKAFQMTEPVVMKAVQQYHGRFSIYTILNTASEITKQFQDLFDEFKTTILLVFMLLLLFLGIRQAIISTITVPLTFLASFAIIHAFGLTLNFLTMFSFLLSLGLLIDDTIVSVAAMTRYYKIGKFTPYQTGLMVWRDFIVPLWSTTITTIWAFVPLLLATGIIGEFIKSIPIVVTVTMLSSTTIAVLITIPLMIVFLKPQFAPRVTKLLKVLGLIGFMGALLFFLPQNNVKFIVVLVAVLALLVSLRIRKELVQKYQKTIAMNDHMKRFDRGVRHIADHGIINIESLISTYRTAIEKILDSSRARKRTLIAITAFALVAYALVPLGFVKNEFFPKDDAQLAYASLELPQGTRSEILHAEAIRVAERLRSTPELDYMVTEVGSAVSSGGDRESLANAVLYTLHFTDKDERTLTSGDIAQIVRDQFSGYTKGKFSVIELTGGPPAGADIQIKLKGDDLGVLNQYADKVVAYLRKQQGIINVDTSIKKGTSKVVFTPDKARLADAGISVSELGLWLRTYASGFTLDTVLFGDEEKDITFRTSVYDQKPLSDLGSIEVPLRSGGAVPLASLGSFKLETNPTIITREDEKRTISVLAGVQQGVNIPEKNTELLAYARSLKLPQGYEWATGGVNEENEKSVQSILQAMMLAFLLIVITMVIEFGSFRQALMAMLIIPISIAGVLYIFALTRTPLSFAALIGILALFGIVVTHVIVVIEKINENRAHGLELRDAIADAAANRLEPVLLTSLATILGLVPITIADPFWRGLGGAIISGLLFSGALKLFFIPVLYYTWFSSE